MAAEAEQRCQSPFLSYQKFANLLSRPLENSFNPCIPGFLSPPFFFPLFPSSSDLQDWKSLSNSKSSWRAVGVCCTHRPRPWACTPIPEHPCLRGAELTCHKFKHNSELSESLGFREVQTSGISRSCPRPCFSCYNQGKELLQWKHDGLQLWKWQVRPVDIQLLAPTQGKAPKTVPRRENIWDTFRVSKSYWKDMEERQ